MEARKQRRSDKPFGGLPTELSWKIFLDRYTVKDQDRAFEPGDLAILPVVEDRKWSKKEVGEILEVKGDTVVARFLTGPDKGEVMEFKRLACDRPLETSLDEVAARIGRGLAAVEPDDERRERWAKAFRDEIAALRVIPGGRVWAGAGTGTELTLFNCVAAETPVHTKDGIRPIGELRGPVEILTFGGQYRTAVFGSYGIQRLFRVTLENGDEIYATAAHEWLVTKPKGGFEVVTTLHLAGRNIPLEPPAKPEIDPRGVAHGIVFGDGSRGSRGKRAVLELCGDAQELLPWVQPYARSVTKRRSSTFVYGLPLEFKELPSENAGPSYWRGFIVGLLAADGSVDERGAVVLTQSRPHVLEAVRSHAAEAGFLVSQIREIRAVSNFGPGYAPCLALGFYRPSVRPEDLLLSKHRERFQRRIPRMATVRVVSVEPTDRVEEVFCCNEPETHTMVIGQGYVTRQCYVIPSPHDSREGIVRTLHEMMEIMARGGGVGINVSSLRPFRAPVRSVNGRSSGAVSWMEIYSYATGLIEQAGARRGALMLQLDCRHPDLQQFIDVKKQPGRVENANISVRVTDEFMQAVKEDREWVFWFPDTDHPDYDRVWRGDFDDWERRGLPKVVYGRRPAREVWREIVKAAWECAEPGVVFSTRHEKDSNSWYFNPLICTNPCVTGDTLVYTDRGLRRVSELFLEGGENAVVVDSRFGTEPVLPASRVFLTGFKPVYRLVTREGYEVRLTEDHRVMTDRGWVEARDLRPGDRIHVLDRPGGFGTEGSYELGLVLGWLVGDGTLKRDRAVLSFFGEEKRELAPILADAVNAVVRTPVKNREYAVGVVQVETRDEARVQSQRLLELAEEHGLLDHKASVPEAVFRGTREMQVGFLRALFSADGHVEFNPRLHRNVVLSSKHLTLLKDVQRLLLNFGIFSKIYRNRRPGGLRSMPDGRGGHRTYRTEPLHDLRIMGPSLVRFRDEIGFLHGYKQEVLDRAVSSYARGPYGERFVAQFEALIPDGEEPVFDLTVPGVHAFTANGIVVHNCAEQPLPAWGVCTLGHLNLARMYDPERGDVDWDRLRRSVHVLVRLLDNVVDATPYFMEENRRNQMSERRIGAGTMGLGELLIHLKLRYGSPEAVEFTDRLYRFIATEAYRASVELAREKGPFPKFDAEKYLQSGFMQRMPEEIRELVRKHGIRNVTVLTQAPTGTVGTMVDTSTGIEPYYAFEYVRKSRLGEDKQYVRIVKEWMEAHPGEPLPDYFVTANDLTPEEHVRMQAAIQRWTDSSISKTANCPADYTLEDTEKLYMLAYDLGCKGVTIYRDRSRYEQVLYTEQPAGGQQGEGQPQGAAVAATVAAQGAAPPAAVAWGRIKPLERPRRLQGLTMRKETPLGNLYITLNTYDGRPFEVFAQIGKAGSDVAAFTEAIARLVSLCFRCGIDPQEVIDQLTGIGGSRHVGFGPNRVRSVPDALAQALEEYLRGTAQEDPEALRARGQLSVFEAAAEGAPGAEPAAGAEPTAVPARVGGAGGKAVAPAVEGMPRAAVNGHRHSFDLCPDCGSHAVVYQEGCEKCQVCGWSRC